MSHEFSGLFLICFFVSAFVMVVTWFFAKAKNNYSVVDAVWALSFGLMALIAAVWGSGAIEHRILILVCVGTWSLRLGSFLTHRIFSHHPKEDGRYVELRAQYGEYVERGFFWFFQYQAYSVAILSIPFLFIAVNPESGLRAIEWVGAAVFILSVLGEGTADAQMKRFKHDPKNAGKTCDVGLWRYSRHPNYFFESCIWWGFYLIALGSEHGIYTVFAPLTILFLLLKVTGVPMAEKQSLKSRGDEYRAYQKRTSVFIPWFRKSLVLFLIFGSLAKAALPPERIAKIYPLGKTSGEPTFLQKTQYQTVKSGPNAGQTESKTSITDAQGKVVLTEVAYFDDHELHHQVVEQFQTQNHFEMKNDGDRVFFYKRSIEDKQEKKVSESHDRLPERFVMGPTTEAFLAKHWNELMSGKTVECQFGVMEVKDTFGFEFTLKGKTTINGKEAVQIEMKPTSFLIGMAVDAFQIFVDPKEKRFMKFVGRTPLMVQKSGDLEPFDGEVIYQ